MEGKPPITGYRLTTVDMIVLHHFYYLRDLQITSEAETRSVNQLIQLEMLERKSMSKFAVGDRLNAEITERGRVYVERLRQVPLPVKSWVCKDD